MYAAAQPFIAAMLDALGDRRPFEGAAIHPFRGLPPQETIRVERLDGTVVDLTLKEQLVEFAQVYEQAGYGITDVYLTSIGYNDCDAHRDGLMFFSRTRGRMTEVGEFTGGSTCAERCGSS